jgi:hypothetical protein
MIDASAEQLLESTFLGTSACFILNLPVITHYPSCSAFWQQESAEVTSENQCSTEVTVKYSC